MRQFLVVGHDAPATDEFSLDDLPGAGRLDLLARCVTSGLLLSHGIREDARVLLVLGDAFTLRFEGAELRGLHPDERSTAARVRSALAEREEAIGHVEVETSPGVYLSRRDLAATLADAAGATTVQLHDDGDPVVDLDPPADPLFVLSDHRDFGDGEAALIADHADARVSLGPERLHADQAITVAHNYLDTDGYARY
ncbi:MAG: tRNA (pseudouridine(54)-N(1))-methyltransferase TrmY [Haloarculaceae archaeon]